MRIFAVTGIPSGKQAPTTARATDSSSGQSRSRAEPPFFETILFTGQPKFRSMKSGCAHSMTARAASARRSGSAPKSCTPTGRSTAGSKSIICRVRSLRCRMPSAETNSVVRTSAPISLQSWRNPESVPPAMGARNNGKSIWPASLAIDAKDTTDYVVDPTGFGMRPDRLFQEQGEASKIEEGMPLFQDVGAKVSRSATFELLTANGQSGKFKIADLEFVGLDDK